MFWNNIGRYDDVSPDPGTSQYKGAAYEAGAEYRKPALSSANLMYPQSVQNEHELQEIDMSVFDSVRADEIGEQRKKSGFPSISDIRKLWQAYESDKHQI